MAGFFVLKTQSGHKDIGPRITKLTLVPSLRPSQNWLRNNGGQPLGLRPRPSCRLLGGMGLHAIHVCSVQHRVGRAQSYYAPPPQMEGPGKRLGTPRG